MQNCVSVREGNNKKKKKKKKNNLLIAACGCGCKVSHQKNGI